MCPAKGRFPNGHNRTRRRKMKLNKKSKAKLKAMLTEVFLGEFESNKSYYANKRQELIRMDAAHRVLTKLVEGGQR
jgi:hypothetical protein